MFLSSSYIEVKEKVAQSLEKESGIAVSTLAEQLGLTEGEVTLALPDECVSVTDGKNTEAILSQLPEWGKVTTIVHSFGSIFEFKNPFPKGKVAHGYYNIMGKEGLHGHLKIDLVKHIAFVSKPFRSMESHYMGFYTQQGHCVFKVYLGRDKSRQLIPQQIEAFQALKKEYTA
ncbi:heme utilization cystosolic carrier protein HutX [Vibrio sp. YMD68]|uniref:heme utilization cystosolic carrier protein HutX n=1 Tax=Vibrio sp. YMD68 TaxID=3042300 RepID=UPI00249AB8C1|nr:heme utilization cystosolic carrier protein HutX [Vibrio sp. YMD68]WGV98953.1 heme utilization cystosolic carrier protein HutX [Vibrio sp. YMD68]